jgi:exopolysaccharide biosynthesis polyprenyl glycosylphosphotransferase
MLLARVRHNRFFLQICDALLACAGLLLAHVIRIQLYYAGQETALFSLPEIDPIESFLIFLPVLFALTPYVTYRLGLYRSTLAPTLSQLLNLCLQASLVLFLALVGFQFLVKLQLSRLVLLLFVPLYCGLLLGRICLVNGLQARHMKSNAADKGNLILVTDRSQPNDWSIYLERNPQWGFRLDCILSPVKLDLESFVKRLHDHNIQLVIFDVRHSRFADVALCIEACEEEGIEAWLAADFLETRIAQARVDYFEYRPILIFRSTPDSSWQLLAKELFDRLAAAAFLAVLAPLLLAITLAIRLTSPGPALFRQQRSGLYGRPFFMFKFRSMVADAEARRDTLAASNEMSGPVFKVRKDPRVTPVGAFLRKTSLDELPQLFNVLRGEMSLVGPRPLPLYETSAISKNAQRRRLSVKPGITGLWQVSGRNTVNNFEDWVRLDLQYIDTWSFWLDLKILLKTIPAVLRGTGL